MYHGGDIENTITFMFVLPKQKIGVTMLINMNDELITNNLMGAVAMDMAGFLLEKENNTVNFGGYRTLHGILNGLYLVVTLLAIGMLIGAWKKKHSKVKTIVLTGVQITMGILLLSLPKLIEGAPLWVAWSFTRDLFFVIIFNTVLFWSGAIVRLCRLYFLQRKK